MDPPLHFEYRRFLNRLVASASRRAGKSLVQSIVDEVIKSSRPSDSVDMIKGFAIPVVAKVLFRFIGFPAEDEEEFLSHAQLFVLSRRLGLGGEGVDSFDPFQVGLPDQVATEVQWMHEYIRRRIAGERHRATDGLLGLLMATEWRTHFHSREVEAASILMDFVQAGLMNTSTALCNGVGHLATNRDDRETLLAHPALAPCMTDELLRIYPLAMPGRTVRRDVALAGVQLYVGEVVVPLLGLGNRDATVFEQPGRVLLDRPNRRWHLAFGVGPHYCLGAALAHRILTASFAAVDRVIQHYELYEG